MNLTRDQILGAFDLPTELVPVPEWNGAVTIRMLSGREAADWSGRANSKEVPDAERGLVTMVVMVALSVIDPAGGGRLFSDEDVETLRGKNPNAINRIFKACLKLNAATAADVEDLEKN